MVGFQSWVRTHADIIIICNGIVHRKKKNKSLQFGKVLRNDLDRRSIVR